MKPRLRFCGGCWVCAMHWPWLYVVTGFGSTPTLAYDDWLEHFRGKGDVVQQPKRRHWFRAASRA